MSQLEKQKGQSLDTSTAANTILKPGLDSLKTEDPSKLILLENGTRRDGPRPVENADNVRALTSTLRESTIQDEKDSSNAQTKHLPASSSPPTPPAKSEKAYLDPTPKTPVLSRKPSAQDTRQDHDERNILSEAGLEKRGADDNESAGEIQSIMDQFVDESVAPTRDEIMSPRLEKDNPMSKLSTSHPPRRSSLEPLRSRDMDAIALSPVTTTTSRELPSSPPPPVPSKLDYVNFKSPAPSLRGSAASITSKLPTPEPEPELPFDFHRFLEQLRHKSADPVAKFLRSFLTEFGKKQWLVHEQVKIIQDFLAFITNKMAQCDVWREVSDNEFDNAKEGMEKLVMNRLYSQTFSPAIPPPPHARTRSKSRTRQPEKLPGSGRRGQHQEDIERDEVLSQKIRIYSWIREEHLEIPPVGANGERFLRLAQQELLKIKGYRAPRDKVICILNCCKVIFGLLKNASTSSDTSADAFVPLLIYVVLQANPEHLVSNIQYILRFRNQDKLSGEAGYYLSSLSGAIQFIESLDRTTLTVSDEEFERNVEQAVAAIAAQSRESETTSPILPSLSASESTRHGGHSAPRPSMDAAPHTPRRSRSTGASPSSSEMSDDPIGGLLKTIQKPLSSIGRIFSDSDGVNEGRFTGEVSSRRVSTSASRPHNSEQPLVQAVNAEEAAARQASAEAAEARRLQRAEHRTVVDTLCGMFPNLDREVIDDVVRQKQGRVGLAVDACLSLTAGG